MDMGGCKAIPHTHRILRIIDYQALIRYLSGAGKRHYRQSPVCPWSTLSRQQPLPSLEVHLPARRTVSLRCGASKQNRAPPRGCLKKVSSTFPTRPPTVSLQVKTPSSFANNIFVDIWAAGCWVSSVIFLLRPVLLIAAPFCECPSGRHNGPVFVSVTLSLRKQTTPILCFS